MIDLDLLAPISLRDLKVGELFLPPASGMFLGGLVNDDPACVALRGDDPFHTAPVGEWNRPNGLRVSSIRFEVDFEAAIAATEVDSLPGALIKGSNGLFIIGTAGHNRFAVSLQPQASETYPIAPRVGFRRWQIVIGSGAQTTVLFSFDAAN